MGDQSGRIEWNNTLRVIISGFGICYMLNVYMCALSRYLSLEVEIGMIPSGPDMKNV